MNIHRVTHTAWMNHFKSWPKDCDAHRPTNSTLSHTPNTCIFFKENMDTTTPRYHWGEGFYYKYYGGNSHRCQKGSRARVEISPLNVANRLNGPWEQRWELEKQKRHRGEGKGNREDKVPREEPRAQECMGKMSGIIGKRSWEGKLSSGTREVMTEGQWGWGRRAERSQHSLRVTLNAVRVWQPESTLICLKTP